MAAAIRNLLLLTIIAITVFCADGYGVYQLVWSDEFDGTTLNTSNWSYDIGNGSGVGEIVSLSITGPRT